LKTTTKSPNVARNDPRNDGCFFCPRYAHLLKNSRISHQITPDAARAARKKTVAPTRSAGPKTMPHHCNCLPATQPTCGPFSVTQSVCTAESRRNHREPASHQVTIHGGSEEFTCFLTGASAKEKRWDKKTPWQMKDNDVQIIASEDVMAGRVSYKIRSGNLWPQHRKTSLQVICN